jgi:predicted PurR-regulated permease PerM
LGNLKRSLNAKYKLMMILFLALIIISFGFVGLYPPALKTVNNLNNSFESYLNSALEKCDSLEENLSQASSSDLRNKSGKFAMLINYTITLANFMLFFTVSLGETATKALSI